MCGFLFLAHFHPEFTFDGVKLQKVASPAEAVRAEAWTELKEIIASAPRQEGEQAYSRASNMAVRNRSSGYYTELIAVIEQSLLDTPDAVTSYAVATLAQLYTWEAKPDWRRKYDLAVAMSLDKMSTESPVSSWYKHTARELIQNASRLSEVDGFLEQAAVVGIPKETWVEAVKQIVAGK